MSACLPSSFSSSSSSSEESADGIKCCATVAITCRCRVSAMHALPLSTRLDNIADFSLKFESVIWSSMTSPGSHSSVANDGTSRRSQKMLHFFTHLPLFFDRVVPGLQAFFDTHRFVVFERVTHLPLIFDRVVPGLQAFFFFDTHRFVVLERICLVCN